VVFRRAVDCEIQLQQAASVTFAPGFLAENAAHVAGALNTLPFSDEGPVNQTVTGPPQTVSTTNNVVLPGVAAETRALHILTAPGDYRSPSEGSNPSSTGILPPT